jgi:hypothetical protein
MSRYRLECVDITNRTVWEQNIDCADDLDALDKARSFNCADDIYIWKGARYVARVPKQKEKLPLFTRIRIERQPQSGQVIPIRRRANTH